MSHFTVLVIGDDVEEQLEPYWELDLAWDDLIADPRAVFEVEIPAAEVASKAKETAEEYIKWLHGKNVKYGKLKAKGDYEAIMKDIRSGGLSYEPEHFAELVEQEMESNRESMHKYRSYLKAQNWCGILKDYHSGYENEDGDWGYYHNPKAKWDWHQLGGRWQGKLRLKPGSSGVQGEPSLLAKDWEINPEYADQAKMKDIDWSYMRHDPERLLYAKLRWQSAMGGEKKSSPFSDSAERLLEKYNDVQEYIKRQMSFTTFAVVTADGKWHEVGEMGLWAMSTNTPDDDRTWELHFWDAFLAGLDPETQVTVMDCHV